MRKVAGREASSAWIKLFPNPFQLPLCHDPTKVQHSEMGAGKVGVCNKRQSSTKVSWQQWKRNEKSLLRTLSKRVEGWEGLKATHSKAGKLGVPVSKRKGSTKVSQQQLS